MKTVELAIRASGVIRNEINRSRLQVYKQVDHHVISQVREQVTNQISNQALGQVLMLRPRFIHNAFIHNAMEEEVRGR